MKKLFLLAAMAFSLNAAMIEFDDVVGHHVKLDAPAKKIAIGLYYTEFLAVGGPKAFDNVVGFSKETWAEWNANSWQMYIKKMPELDKIPDFGESGSFSSEKVISLEPDVLVLAKVQYDGLKDQLKPIEAAGIPVVVVDYHTGKFHRLSTEIFGKITDHEARAKEIMDRYEHTLKTITERTSKITKKATAYVEYGYAGAKDNGSTYSHFMWGDLIDKAGVDNIANGLVKSHGSINPETILIKDPDIIIIAGREAETKKGETMIMGNEISFKDANERLKTFLARDGWKDLKAVKSGNVFGGYHGMLRNLSDIFMIEYIAKAAYPDVFKDLDPKKEYQEFNAKYLPVVPEGTFMLKLNDEKF